MIFNQYRDRTLIFNQTDRQNIDLQSVQTDRQRQREKDRDRDRTLIFNQRERETDRQKCNIICTVYLVRHTQAYVTVGKTGHTHGDTVPPLPAHEC